jgi:NAD(P)-dependent dehydrogenase (short-subunit alcohol dehydrogenase family)
VIDRVSSSAQGELSSEVAFVTGAGRGIGAAVCRRLTQMGARVAVTARRLEDAGRVVAGLAERLAVALECNVVDPDSLKTAVAVAADRFGPISILVNNAGVVQPIGLLHEIDPSQWSQGVVTNLVGAANAAHAVLPAMLAVGHGSIINLSSGAAHRPLEGWSAYCAAKAGLAMLTRSLALEYGERGVRAFGFAPGLVDTDMQAEIRASGVNQISGIAREALGDPDDVARAVAYLCTTGAGLFAGEEIDIRHETLRAAAGLPPLRA